MDNLLKALADLLNVGTDTIKSIVDTTGVVLPDLVETLIKELPLFRLFSTIQLTFLILFGVSLIPTGVYTFGNGVEYGFKDKYINKINKNFALLSIIFLVVFLGMDLLQALLTPTTYSIEYLVDQLHND